MRNVMVNRGAFHWLKNIGWLATAMAIGCVTTTYAADTSATHTIGAPDGRGKVTIYRDDWGVPHIYAAREEDGFFGLGYAQAEDHLERLLQLVLAIQGRGSAAFGSASVSADLNSIQWRHLEEGRSGFARLSAQLRKNYAGYNAGLLRFMADHPQSTPAWAPALEPWFWVAFSRGLFWDYMSQDGLRACRDGGAKLSAATHDSLRRGDAGLLASNEWFLAPWRSADNATVLLSDPHAEIDGDTFYEFRMRAGALDVEGYTIGPLMLLMHNHDVAWGMTTGAPLVSDCYAVKVDPSNPRRYLYDGKMREMIVRPASVTVKDGASVSREFEYTMHNGVFSPVVGRSADTAFVVSSGYMDAAGLFDEEIYRMNRARNVAEIKAAHELMGMFPQNVMSADRFGNSYYLRAGRAPRRPPGFDWSHPVPGNTSATAWLGVHRATELVHLQDPASGYMQNNNTPPSMMIADHGGPRPEDYLDYLYNDAPMFHYTMRGARAVEVLSQTYAMTVDGARTLAVDEKWYGTERWIGALQRALDDQRDSVRAWKPLYRELAQRLLRFDGFAHADSEPALAYFHWRTVVQGRLTSEQAAGLDAALRSNSPTPADISRELAAAVPAAADAMMSVYGTIDRRYGDAFRIGRTPERSWPVGGGVPLDVRRHSQCKTTSAISLPCPLTLRAFVAGAPDAHGVHLITAGSRALRLVIFTDPLQSYTLHNYGQSSDPASPHYDDQASELVSKAKLKATYFDPNSLRAHVRSTLTLQTRMP